MNIVFKFINGETVTVNVPQKLTAFYMEEKKRTKMEIKKKETYRRQGYGFL